MDDPNLAILVPIAQALGDLCESLVFVGGCATGLLLTAQRAQTSGPVRKKATPLPGPLPASGERGLSGRWRAYSYDELINRDKLSLDIFWLRDDTLEDSNNLLAPDVLAAEIVADLEAALEQFREVVTDLGGNKA